MDTKVFLTFLSMASAIYAQSATPSRTPLMPACFVGCQRQFCSVGDLQCLCIAHVQDVNECLRNNCSNEDQSAAASLEALECCIYTLLH